MVMPTEEELQGEMDPHGLSATNRFELDGRAISLSLQSNWHKNEEAIYTSDCLPVPKSIYQTSPQVPCFPPHVVTVLRRKGFQTEQRRLSMLRDDALPAGLPVFTMCFSLTLTMGIGGAPNYSFHEDLPTTLCGQWEQPRGAKPIRGNWGGQKAWYPMLGGPQALPLVPQVPTHLCSEGRGTPWPRGRWRRSPPPVLLQTHSGRSISGPPGPRAAEP